MGGGGGVGGGGWGGGVGGGGGGGVGWGGGGGGGGLAVGNSWIATEHHSKSVGFYLPIHTRNVLLKFGFDVESQTDVTVQKPKNPIWPSGGHFEIDIAENW